MFSPISPSMLVVAAMIGTVSAFLAHRREKNPYLWFALGFLFGIFGIFAIFFLPNRKKESPPQAPVLSITGPEDKMWYYLDPENNQKGPMSHNALTKAFREGKITPSTYVWHEEMKNWIPLEETLSQSL